MHFLYCNRRLTISSQLLCNLMLCLYKIQVRPNMAYCCSISTEATQIFLYRCNRRYSRRGKSYSPLSSLFHKDESSVISIIKKMELVGWIKIPGLHLSILVYCSFTYLFIPLDKKNRGGKDERTEYCCNIWSGATHS